MIRELFASSLFYLPVAATYYDVRWGLCVSTLFVMVHLNGDRFRTLLYSNSAP